MSCPYEHHVEMCVCMCVCVYTMLYVIGQRWCGWIIASLLAFTADSTDPVLGHIPHPRGCLWTVQVSCAGCWSSTSAPLTWLWFHQTSSYRVHVSFSSQQSSVVPSAGLPLDPLRPSIWYRKGSVALLCFCEAWGMWTSSQTLTRSMLPLNLFSRLLVTCSSNKQRERFPLFSDSHI